MKQYIMFRLLPQVEATYGEDMWDNMKCAFSLSFCRQVDIPVVSNEECQDQDTYGEDIQDNMRSAS